jgi:hypothetical protein
MHTTPAPVPQPPAWARLLRSMLIVAVILAFTVVAALFFVGTTFSLMDTYFKDEGKPPGGLIVALGVIITLLPLGLAILAARRRWLTWPVLGIASLAAAGVLAWLAWDDPTIRHPLTVEEIAPAFDDADKSYAVLMEYGKQQPTEDSKAFSARKQTVQFSGIGPGDGEKWAEFISKNRAGLEAEWTAAAPQRAWLGRLNAFDRIGDLTPADFDADIPRFDIWRFLAQRTAAIASLQALDGSGDEAIATLLPMLEVSRKFETSSRTLVRLMIARVSQKLCYQTAAFIMDRGNPSPASRARLLAALEGGNGPAGARRIVQVEYVLFTPILARLSFSDAMSAVSWGGAKRLPAALNALTRLLINPCATANLYGDQVKELAALAEARDLGGFAARQQAFSHATMQGGMKNLGGRLLLNMATPAYQKVLENYWKIEDLRLEVRARLASG